MTENKPTVSAPQEIIDLVDRFTGQRAAYRSGHYNETQLRRDFLDPLFEALGWDLTNRKNYSEKYREVIHERSVEVEGQAKAADYAFQSGGNIHFFLEAKKPAVAIETNPEPAFQIRRYAWSAKIPISLLSDFEQLAVYDCREKPVVSDPAHYKRVLLYEFDEYVSKWDEIYRLFSYQAVHQGSLEQFAVSLKGKKGTADVDDAFLVEMERWREELARNIALRNPALTTRELNSAVQLTIDRIIFLRICEERGIEAENALRDATDGKDVYGDLLVLFNQADKKYNSGLFHFNVEKSQSSYPDTLTPSLKIDDKVLKDILANLYYPRSPYAFKYIPADILGQVYERFLGKVIRLTAGHQAKVEEKPEVRKAGGVYYTPTYIVEYIVKNTMGELLKDNDPEAIKSAPLRVLDPACGSGSFLLGAYQYLLDWYLNWYVTHDPAKWVRGKNPAIYETRDSWQLTMEKKKEILTSHIFGVDIDAQAVEVTKLSLLLKVVENPGQLSLMSERILPDLGKNIQCGNSLIGPDYYDGQQLGMFDSEEQYRVNAFDWQKAFPQVFRDGGFDAVIGNPPYVRQESLGEQKKYFQTHYQAFHGIADLYVYFIERGVKLLRTNGLFCYIVANKWMRSNYGLPLRNWLKSEKILQIIDFGDLAVFEQATTYPCIIRIRSEGKAAKEFRAIIMHSLDFADLQEFVEANSFFVDTENLQPMGWSLVNTNTSKFLLKLSAVGQKLGEYANGKLFRGIITGLNEAFVINSDTRASLILEDNKNEQLIKPFLLGRDIKRYQSPTSERYIIMMPKGWTRHTSKNARNAWGWLQQQYPSIARHLAPFANKADKRFDKGEYWWELRACDYYGEFTKPKLILPDISLRGNFYFDDSGKFYSANTTYFIPTDDKYLLGLLNSRLITYYYGNISATYQGGYFRFFIQYLEQLPIRTIDFSNPADVKRHERMVSLVECMLTLHKQSAAARLPDEKERLERQIQATDRQIDMLVYELYGMTGEEIKIVEGRD